MKFGMQVSCTCTKAKSHVSGIFNPLPFQDGGNLFKNGIYTLHNCGSLFPIYYTSKMVGSCKMLTAL